MGFLDAKPLEFGDFSGGLTDNFLRGDTKRFQRGDNFLITIDRKLESRYGTVIYDPVGYSLPGGNGRRVTSLFTGLSESLLFAHCDRNLYTQQPDASYGTAWTKIVGPTGNEPLAGGDLYSQLSTCEFAKKQIYFTSDALVQPGKIFKDETNSWKAVTAGIPRMAWSFTDDSQLLTKCIRLANAIRASMIGHMNDDANQFSGRSTVYLHNKPDKYSLSYLATQTFTGSDPESPPSPLPTPAPDATDQTTLFALCLGLSLAYEHHRNDLAGETPATSGSGNTTLHQDILYKTNIAGTSGSRPSVLGINAKLTTSGVVTTLKKAATFLDELAQKWYWHQLSPLSHSPTNDYSMMSRYLVREPKIGTLYQNAYTVQVTPDYTEFLAFAIWLKTVYNIHVLNTNTSSHTQADTSWTSITLPDPVDYDSAALIIFWLRYLYGNIHVYDSNVSLHTRVTFDMTAGSPNLTNVKLTSSGAAMTLSAGLWISTDLFGTDDWQNPADPTDPNYTSLFGARVLSSGLGTAVMSKNAANTTAANVGQYSTAFWHVSYNNGLGFNDNTTALATTAEFLATGPGAVGADLKAWVAMGTEFILALGAHEANGNSHIAGAYNIVNDLQGTSTKSGNPFYIPTVATLAWAAFYRYQYTVEQAGIIYVNEGTPVYSNSVQVCQSYPLNTVITTTNSSYFSDALISQVNPCARIVNIPALANTATTNYDTVTSVAPIPDTGFAPDLTVELYRTTDGGTTFYYEDSLTNGTTSYSDTLNDTKANLGDTILNTRKDIYTTGGVLANDLPPQCKFVHSVQGYTYYGAIVDTGQFFPQRIIQSKNGNPDSAPVTNSDDLEDDLVGLSSTRTHLLGFCKNSVYRFTGAFTDSGDGLITHDRIADTIGALNSRSIVKTEIGVFFAGTDGFYFTDGYQMIKLTIDLNATYAALTQSDSQKSRIYGAYDKLTRRIWWAMQSNPTSADNDCLYIFYLDYGTKPDGVFTKALTTQSWMPASVCFYKGKMILGDTRGYLFKSDYFTKTDPKINTELAPSLWTTAYIPYAYRSCAVDFGTEFKRKWVTRIHAVGQNVGNAAIQINSINDAGTNQNGGNSTLPLPPLQYVRNTTWGDARQVWGTTTDIWKYDGAMDSWRRFPSKSMRSDFKQIEYVPGNFNIYRSDDYPNFCFAAVSGLTATIATPSGYSAILWPLDVIDYYISFDTDSYATKYLITALDVTKKIITFTDPSGTIAANTGAKWQISGYKKEQRIRITSFEVHFAYLGDENANPTGASDGTGAGSNA